MFFKIRPYYLFIFALLSLAIYSCGSDDDEPIIDPDPIVGCTDPDAINFNPDATEDNGDCEYLPSGFLGELAWAKTYGGSNEEGAISVVLSNDGGYMVLGNTRSTDGDITGKTTIDLDYWLLKIDVDGEKIWDRTYGGSQDDKATSIASTTDGGYIMSGYTMSDDGDVSENAGFHDFWIVKIDGSGEVQWEKSWGFEGDDRGFNVIQTLDGGYFATGELDVGFIEGDEGNDLTDGQSNSASQHSLGDFWGIKMDADGNKIWRRYFGGSNIDESQDVLETEDGGFLMIGNSESTDFDITDARGANDFWVIKINSEGDLLWQKSLGGSEPDFAFRVAEASNGNFIITGDTRSSDFDVSSFKGNADVWAVKFNGSNGSIIWEKTFGGSHFDTSRGITKLADGNYIISGSSTSTDLDVSSNYGLNDAWAFIIDEDGNLKFEINVGGTGIDFAFASVQTQSNELVIVGNTNSSDGDITENKGGNDLLIYKLK